MTEDIKYGKVNMMGDINGTGRKASNCQLIAKNKIHYLFIEGPA